MGIDKRPSKVREGHSLIKGREGNMNGTRNKLVFISDLHMNNHFSFAPTGDGYSHAYTWLDENIPTVAAFLNWLGKREDVAELIILGDLFDGWVCPMHHAPTMDFMDILTAPENAPIVDALKSLCKKQAASKSLMFRETMTC